MSTQDAQATQAQTFQEVKDQLDSIVEQVSRDDIALEDALNLYEEAVSLGLQASRLMEADITRRDAEELAASFTETPDESKVESASTPDTSESLPKDAKGLS